MQDSELLSTFAQSEKTQAQQRGLQPLIRPAASAPAAPLSIFDVCHIGVIARAVLFVQALIVVLTSFGSGGLADWLLRAGSLTFATLPGVLAWLVIACAAKRWLNKLRLPQQYLSGTVLGALCGVYSAALASWAGVGSWVWPGGVAWPKSVWLGSVLAGALLGWLLVAGLVARARALTPAATRARLDELQSRIRPHFLFNALNSAIALVRDDPKRAESVLEDLSELFRSALANPEQATTLGDEIELARRYLAIEAVRFGERMQVDWSLDRSVDHIRMPPLVLQPLVENAVRHGVEPTDAPVQIKISTLRRGDNVVVRVTNTLAEGMAPKPGHGIALANVRERLKLMHDVRARFQAQAVDGLFQSRIEVPYERRTESSKDD